MRYVSTRGGAEPQGFFDVLLGGLAPDGGLYLPERWPQLPPLDRLRGRPYAEVAAEVMWPFVAGEFERAEFDALVADTYAVFDHPDVCPVRNLGDGLYLTELFWGPTLAFKDVALQLVGRLFDVALRRRGERLTVLGATSGDTGSAAMEGCRHSDAVEVFILFPDGRVSEVQRRQMTTLADPSLHAVAVEGDFDDCQRLVKAAFADEAFRTEVNLGAVNSINWARVMAQIVYYVTSHLAVSPDGAPVSFAVPTGNFGNVFAGWAAQAMGLPVGRLIVASNRNDILVRFLDRGAMVAADVVATSSPSMDIGVSSNFERLLFEATSRDGGACAATMAAFAADGEYRVLPEVHGTITDYFDGVRVSEDEVDEEMAAWHRRGLMVEPHSAIGLRAAEARRVPGVPIVALATAHPAKFPDAVEAATGVRPELPEALADLLERPEHAYAVAADLADVQNLMRAHADDGR
ncbi:threonine synthase [Candidatus Neomicrothrix sp.]|jgi:threonine synthase|uniref:threonine synthase n=1 Tax=Candidatus Neomicrothrix sp. TaxID=2719034 RepID=UPI0025913985|nr:threonine synthase [Candidatus Microthrix sp.]HMS47194.1 threonine synthase [Candidatus Microthrix sp.]